MSNALALAAVTAVLKGMLEKVLVEQDVSDRIGAAVTVTALSPDRIQTGDEEKPQLNLFLYHVAPNAGWRNVDLPSHGRRGERLTNQPLALDLHYLVTAYGKADFELEVLLGYAAQAFHEQPVLSRDLVRNMLTAAATPGGSASPVAQALAASDLAEQVELVKLAPQMIGTEEMYRVWSAFQSHYRPTVAYQASVVLIEDRRPIGAALPVLVRQLQALPFRQATIETVLPQVVTAGSRLIIQGRNLQGETVRVRFQTATLPPDVVSDRHIEVALPADLPAGVNTVQVVHATESHAFESNVAPFVLRPTVTASGATNVQGSGADLRSADVTVQVDPPIGRSQRVVLLLNERSGDAPAAYSSPAPARDADAGSITIPVTGVPAADYFVRLRVDGADSPLDLDPSSATFGPTVTIP